MVTSSTHANGNAESKSSAAQAIERLRADMPRLRALVIQELQANVADLSGPFSSMRQIPTFADELVAQFLNLLEDRLTPAEIQKQQRYWIQRGLGAEGAFATMDALYQAGVECDKVKELLPALNRYRRTFAVAYTSARRYDILSEQERIQRGLYSALEKQIASERQARRALLRRQTQLQVATDVARVTSSTRDLNELLTATVRHLQESFDFSFVGIFLLDEFRQRAVLRAGSGTLSAPLLVNGYQIHLDLHSPFARALSLHQALFLRDGKYQEETFVEPLQPTTPFALVAPLTAHGQNIGFLTGHGADTEIFSAQDLPILTVIADNVANAIENAELFKRVQANVQALELAQRSYVRETWAAEPLSKKIVYSQKLDEFAEDNGANQTELVPQNNDNATQGALSVPITLRGQVIGTVDLFDVAQPRSWNENERALAASVVEQMALAVENARLFETAQRRAQETALINDMARALSGELDRTRLFKTVYDYLPRLMPTDAFVVWFYDDGTKTITRPALYDRNQSYPNEAAPRAPSGKVAQVIATDKPIVTNLSREAWEQERANTLALLGSEDPSAFLPDPSASLLFVPLRVGNRIRGVLSVQSYQFNAYGDAQAALLTSVGNYVATTLENAQLFAETNKRLNEISLLHNSMQTLTQQLDLNVLLERVVTQFLQVLDVDTSSILSWDPPAQQMVMVYDFDLDPPLEEAGVTRYGLDHYPDFDTALAQGKMQVFRATDPNLTPTMRADLDKWNWMTLLLVPLMRQNEVFGVIELGDRRRARNFTADELRLAESLANQASVALENARLFDQTQQALAETQLLYRTGGQLNQVTSLEELVRIAAQPAFEEGAGSAQLLLMDYQGQDVAVAADVVVSLVSPGERAPLSQYTHFPIEQFELGKVLLANPRELVLIQDVETSRVLDEPTRRVLLASQDHAVVLLPLSVEQRVLGAIAIGWAESHAFSEQERRIYQALAAQLALVLNNRLLFQQIQDALSETQTLYEISARLNAANNVQEALEAAAGPAIVQGAFTASLLRVITDTNGAPNELELTALWPRNSEWMPPIGTRFTQDNILDDSSWIENTHEPLLCENISADARVNEIAKASYLNNDIHSTALLPLKIGERWIGVLNFNWKEPRAFTPRDTRLFRSIMAQAATVLDNRSLFEQTQVALAQTQIALKQAQESQDRLNLQYQTANILARANSFEQMVEQLLENTCRALNWQLAAYWTIDENANRMVLTQMWNEDDQALNNFAAEASGLRFGPGEELAGRSWLEARPIWIPNLGNDPNFTYQRQAQEAGLVSAIAFPLQSETRQYGATVFFTRHPQEVDDALMATMTSVGSQIGQYLERRRAEEAVRQQNTYLTALHDTTLGLMRRLDLDELLQNIITRAGELVGTEHGYVHLVEPSGGELRMRVGVGIYQDFVGTRVKAGQGLAGTVWRDQEPIVVDDYRYWPGRLPMVDRDVLRAVVGVPLKSGNQTVGVLGVASLDEGRKFGAAQIEALDRFAELAAVALDNAQLYNASQQALQQTQRLAQREKASAEIADKLYAAPDVKSVLRTAAEELRRSTGSRRAIVRLNLDTVNPPVERAQPPPSSASHSNGDSDEK